jgi:Uma2 family endonuclease
MQPVRANRYVTAEEFLRSPEAAGPSELVRGEIHVMTPAGGGHGLIFSALSSFVESHELGMCFPDGTGFQLPGLGDTVRSPDAAFVRADRLPPEGIGSGWLAVAPDLVVEVLSPTETASELESKVRDYRAAGTRLIWVIDPATRTVSILGETQSRPSLTESDTLDGEDVVSGFSIPISRLFARLAKQR